MNSQELNQEPYRSGADTILGNSVVDNNDVSHLFLIFPQFLTLN